MARACDVWMVKANTVYRKVPADVVINWLQSGRLTADDRLRAAEGEGWKRLGDLKEFRDFAAPPPEQVYAEQAEAGDDGSPGEYEPVETGFRFRRSSEAEDDDVDMIPLIDVSLVLLVFFMITTTVAAVSSIQVPESRNNQNLVDNPESVTIAVTPAAGGGEEYAVSAGTAAPREGDSGLTRAELLARVEERVKAQSGAAEVRVAADRGVPTGAVSGLLAGLDRLRKEGLIRTVNAETVQNDRGS